MKHTLKTATVIVGSVLLTAIAVGCDKQSASTDGRPVDGGDAKTAAPGLLVVKVPAGLGALPIPADNAMTEAKVELGKMLYFDKRLSQDGTISCATCHDPKMGWAERRASSEGVGKQLGDRNSPTIINAAYMPEQFWDGRAASLEEQALGPIENPIEMGHTLDDVVKNLAQVPEYQKRFQEVFGTGVNKDGIAKAIAAFERTILSGNSPYDQYQAGDKSALTEQQIRGMELFNGKGECGTCHAAPTFSNGKYYNAGIGNGKDAGRKKHTNRDSDEGKFRVPHLRNVDETAPYFHDGSVETLEEAIRIMATGGIDNPGLSPIFKGLKEAALTEAEIADITSFVKTLAGEYPIIEPPALP